MWKRNGLVAVILVLGLTGMPAGCAKKKVMRAVPTPPTVEQPNKADNAGDIPRPRGTDNVSPDSAGKMETIYFDFDKSDIRADQVACLEGNANYLKEHADLKIVIEGHCDEQGSAEYNFALGERRAKSVRDFLISRGVGAERLSMVSKGEEEPAVEGHDAEAWSKNRRSAFKVTFKATN